ncbi:hypothetical protein EV281_111131 [Rhizobium sp. BK418]|nr:hypothetical protein EV281_111131 [Rhizobium sp. BK418]
MRLCWDGRLKPRKRGFSPRHGARPLKGTLRDQQQGVNGQRCCKQQGKKARVFFHLSADLGCPDNAGITDATCQALFQGCICIICSIGIMFCAR